MSACEAIGNSPRVRYNPVIELQMSTDKLQYPFIEDVANIAPTPNSPNTVKLSIGEEAKVKNL